MDNSTTNTLEPNSPERHGDDHQPSPRDELSLEQGLHEKAREGGRGDQDGADESGGNSDKRSITGVRWFLVCLSLYLASLMYGLDTTIAADIQGAVIATFGDVPQLSWVGAGFTLGSVAVILPYGALYARFNQKWLYLGGIVLFEGGSALCGGAPSMGALVVGRVVAGVGGTGLYLGTLNYFAGLTEARERGLYINGIGVVWGLGAVLGPVVGGAFSDSAATWRWSFYINLVLAAVTAPIYLFCLPAIHPVQGGLGSSSVASRLAALDYLGFVLSAGMWVAFTVAFVFGGNIWPWGDGRTIATIVVFAVLLAAYALQQYFCLFTTPDARSFPGQLLRSRSLVLMYIASSAAFAVLLVPTYFIPIYFQFVLQDSSIMAAVRLVPFLAVLICTNLALGWALPRINYYMVVFVASGVFTLLGGTLLYVYLEPSTSTATIYGLSIVVAFGGGLTQQLGYTVGIVKAGPDAVHAINFLNFAQIGASTISLVVAGQVFQSKAVSNLAAALSSLNLSQAELQAAVAGAQSTVFESLDGELRQAAILAITSAIQESFIAVIVAGAVLIVSGALLRFEPLFVVEKTSA